MGKVVTTIKRYKVTLNFTEAMLGTAPNDPEIYQSYISSKKDRLELKTASAEEKAAVRENINKEELKMLNEDADKNLTVFRRNKKKQVILLDHIIRGYLKEASSVIKGMTAYKKKITQLVFIAEREIPLLRDGKPITGPVEVFSRPMRAETPQGPRTMITVSEIIQVPFSCTFTVEVLPHSPYEITEEYLKTLFSYARFCGMGQWRNGSFGRADATITKIADGPAFGMAKVAGE